MQFKVFLFFKDFCTLLLCLLLLLLQMQIFTLFLIFASLVLPKFLVVVVQFPTISRRMNKVRCYLILAEVAAAVVVSELHHLCCLH